MHAALPPLPPPPLPPPPPPPPPQAPIAGNHGAQRAGDLRAAVARLQPAKKRPKISPHGSVSVLSFPGFSLSTEHRGVLVQAAAPPPLHHGFFSCRNGSAGCGFSTDFANALTMHQKVGCKLGRAGLLRRRLLDACCAQYRAARCFFRGGARRQRRCAVNSAARCCRRPRCPGAICAGPPSRAPRCCAQARSSSWPCRACFPQVLDMQANVRAPRRPPG